MKDKFVSKKWLGSNPSVEPFTPKHYLIDFIELSGIKQEEAIDSLHEKYEKYGLTLRELAAGSVHSRDTIAKRIKASGLSLKKPGRPKKVLKQGILYSPEDLYKLVKTKRDCGTTYRMIARDLSSQKVIRKDGSTDWHPMMIKRILDKTKEDHSTR